MEVTPDHPLVVAMQEMGFATQLAQTAVLLSGGQDLSLAIEYATTSLLPELGGGPSSFEALVPPHNPTPPTTALLGQQSQVP